MSFSPPPPPPGNNFKGPLADAATQKREQAIRNRALLNRNDEGISEPRPRLSVAERIKQLLKRGR